MYRIPSVFRIKPFAERLYKPSVRFFSTNPPIESMQESESPRNCIVYDGNCPVCTLAVKKLKGADVSAINARQHPELVRQYKEKGFDLDKGMIVSGPQGEVHFGADAIKELGKKRGGVTGELLSSSWMESVYPLLRGIRNILVPKGIAEEIVEKEAPKVEESIHKMN